VTYTATNRGSLRMRHYDGIHVPERLTFDRNIDDRLEPVYEALEAHPAWIVLAAIAATAGIAWLDRATGVELSLAGLYLGPVAIVAWFLGRVPGWIWSCVAGVASLAVEATTLSAAADSAVVSWNAVTVITLSLVVVETVTRLRRALDNERDLARTDALSGVANARSFRELAAVELEGARRYGHTLTLALLDLDHFKSVNDTLGHAAGDRLIHDVGQAIRWRLRRIDIVARVGGDEFAILLPESDAAAAGVAVPTIYWAFGSKRAIVSEIRQAWLEAAGTAARLREVLAIDEPGARLEAYAAFMANQWATGAEALAIQQDAMRGDPQIAAEIAAVLAERAEGLKAVVAPLAPHLREPLSVETAHAILLALSLLEVYRELRGRGWPDAKYRAWLGDVLREQLLVSDAAKTIVSPPDDSPPRTT